MKTQCVHCGAEIDFEDDDQGLDSTCATCGNPVSLVPGLQVRRPPVVPTPKGPGIITQFLKGFELVGSGIAGFFLAVGQMLEALWYAMGVLILLLAIWDALFDRYLAGIFWAIIGGVIVLFQAIWATRRRP